MTCRYVIVGNGIAGQTCAEALRRADERCSITVLTEERHPLYNRVALPRFLKGQLREEKVLLRSGDDYDRQRIDVRFATRASSLDAESRRLTLESGEVLPFDGLLLATGGMPSRLLAPGIETVTNMHCFYTLDDARRIVAASDEARRILVIGGSFIAYELAEAMQHRGRASVIWLMRGPWFLRHVLDENGGSLCKRLGEAAGVDFVCADAIVRLDGNVCLTQAGRRISFDMLAYGVGLDFNTGLAADAGLDVGRGIRTDSRLQTSAPGIFAAGDVAEFHDVVLGRSNQVGTWDNAQAQGQVAAINMAGGAEDFLDVATYTTTMFGSTLAVMGATSETDPDLEAISEIAIERGHYRKLFFRRDRLVGAVMIGSPKGRKRLIELIRGALPIQGDRRSFLEGLPR